MTKEQTNNWEEIKRFAEDLLCKKGLHDWKVKQGTSGYTWRKSKEIELPLNATKGLVIHEIAHALDENPPENDKHWGYHADLMHHLFDEVISQEKEKWVKQTEKDIIKIIEEWASTPDEEAKMKTYVADYFNLLQNK